MSLKHCCFLNSVIIQKNMLNIQNLILKEDKLYFYFMKVEDVYMEEL